MAKVKRTSFHARNQNQTSKPQILFCGAMKQNWIISAQWISIMSGGRNQQCVEGKINLLKYQEILEENLMLSVEKLKLGHHWSFQQDSEPKQTFNSTKAWLQKKSWKILQWPSQSPYLNPTENLWWDRSCWRGSLVGRRLQYANPTILLNWSPLALCF